MLENPERIEEMVKASGAHSTDMQAEEPVEELTAKTKPYAAAWAPTAERLWNERKEEKARLQAEREAKSNK